MNRFSIWTLKDLKNYYQHIPDEAYHFLIPLNLLQTTHI